MPVEISDWRRSRFAGVIGLTIGYMALAWLCLKFASLHPSATPVWLPAGLAVGVVIAFGRRFLIAVFLGTFGVALLMVDFGNGAAVVSPWPILLSTVIGVGNVFEALAGAVLFDRFASGRRCFDRVSSVFGFVLSAAIAPLISASVGVGVLTLGGCFRRRTGGWSF